MHTSEVFCRNLAVDIVAAMLRSIGSSVVHVEWCMRVHVMVDLFACSDSIRKMRSIYIFNEPSKELFCSLMDNG